MLPKRMYNTQSNTPKKQLSYTARRTLNLQDYTSLANGKFIVVKKKTSLFHLPTTRVRTPDKSGQKLTHSPTEN